MELKSNRKERTRDRHRDEDWRGTGNPENSRCAGPAQGVLGEKEEEFFRKTRIRQLLPYGNRSLIMSGTAWSDGDHAQVDLRLLERGEKTRKAKSEGGSHARKLSSWKETALATEKKKN